MELLQLHGIPVPVELIRKHVRRMNLHVTPDRIWMSIPLRTSRTDAVRFLESQQAWICMQWQRFAEFPEIRPLKTGETIPLWGAHVPIAVHRLPLMSSPSIAQGVLHIGAAPQSPEEADPFQLQSFYRAELAVVLPRVRAHWEQVVGQQAHECRLREMKTRWGSCSITSRRVWLNSKLAQKPPACLDYVMAHELTHLLVPNHSALFWSYMDRFYPNWPAVRQLLRHGA